MRQHVARLLLAASLGGCSLLYNPSNIGTPMDGMPDQPFDAPIDGNPALLSLTTVRPATLLEGQGVLGSRPAILVIEGANIVKQNTMVTIAPIAGSAKNPTLMVDNSKLETSADGMYLVVPVTIPVDKTGLLKTDQIKLDVTVAQDGPGGRISKTLSAMVTVQGLGEIDGALPANELTGGAEHLYSFVNITSPTTIGPAAGANAPILVHSTSSLTIATGVTLGVNASGMNGGPGGGNGGTGGAGTVVGTTPGGVGGGPAGGAPSGNGGGFAIDTQIPTLDVPQRGSGGSGGVGTTISAGTDGGGGGGSISLVADGDLSVGAITAKGGAPGTGGGSAGGGGSGGVIVIRAGRNLSATSLDVSGMTNGAAGHARFDAGGTAMVTTPGAAFRGPMFVDPPVITTTARPTVMVTGKALSTFKYFVQNATGSMIRGPFGGSIPGAGPGVIGWGAADTDALFPGLNQLCLVVATGDPSSDTANCMAIAWVAR